MKKILIADDDSTSRELLAGLLTKTGFTPVTAADGYSAWDILQSPDTPRLLLLDWNMPDINGLELCRRIRTMETNNPPYIIIFTSRDSKADIVKGLEAGANDYITKPCDPEELQARLRVGMRMLSLQDKLTEIRNTLAYQAAHDALTGIYNRCAMLEILTKELARTHRENNILNIGMYDIDHFKQINDKYGHQAGDEILAGFSRRLQDNVRDYTYIGRYGGDEFLVLISGPPDSSFTCIHKRLRGAIADQPFPTSNGKINLTVSIGCAAAKPDSTTDTIIAKADKAMYQAKDTGRNRVVESTD